MHKTALLNLVPKKRLDESRLKLSIIGLGSIGTKHLLLNKQIGSDNSKEIEIHVLKRTSSLVESCLDMIDYLYDRLDDMSKIKYDYVIISSPSSFHYKDYYLMRNSANRFLIEKPLAADVQNANKIHELSCALNHKVFVGYVFRFSPAFLYFKDLIKNYNSSFQNVILESHSYLPLWRRNKNYLHSVSSSSRLGGGVLRELSHELDLLIHLFGYPKYIVAKTETRGMSGIDVEHSCVSFLVSSESVPIQLSMSFNNRKYSRFIRVNYIDGCSITWNLFDNCVTMEKHNEIHETKKFTDDYQMMFKNQNNFFLQDCSSDPAFNAASTKDAVDVMRLIRQIKHSNNTFY